jgi:RNA ligase
MLFEPPKINYINDVLPFIKDKPGFVVKEKGWYTVIDYMYMSNDMFKHPIERECRGLKFDTVSGRLLARPYHKFHNLNERDGYRTEDVDLTRPHVVLDKLDGSMVHTCPSQLGLYLMTRMGITEVAQKADKFLERNAIRYSRLFDALGWSEYTYIFEYVGPDNKIVLDYAKEDLILTAIRNITNGTYVFHDELVKLGEAFGIPVVKDVYLADDVTKLQKEVVADTEDEGVVIRFDTGAMVKIKAEAYVRKHRSKDLVSTQKGVLTLILDKAVDDVLPQLDEATGKKLVDYQTQVNKHIAILAKDCAEEVTKCKDLVQKDFALHVQNHFIQTFQSILFNVRKGDDPYETVVKKIRSNMPTQSRAVEITKQLGLPAWTFSFFKEE